MNDSSIIHLNACYSSGKTQQFEQFTSTSDLIFTSQILPNSLILSKHKWFQFLNGFLVSSKISSESRNEITDPLIRFKIPFNNWRRNFLAKGFAPDTSGNKWNC